MAKKISVKMYLDGATQFNSDVKKINDNLKLLGSEMKQNNEIFKTSQNSAEALRAKSETLNKQYEEAEKKVKAYADRLQEIQKAREKATSDLDKYNDSLQKEQTKLEEIEKTQGRSSEAYAQQKAKVDELQKSVEQTTNVLGQLDQKEIQVQTSLNNATTEQIKYGAELAETNKYLNEAEKSTDGAAKSIDEYGKKVGTAGDSTEKLADTLETMARNEAMEKIGEAAKELLDNLLDCAEVAEKFEYAIAKVQSIAQVSDEELKTMSKNIREVGAEMGYSAGEISEAVYQAISASVDASEAIGFVEDATKLARAGFTETTTSVDVLTTAINAYGKEANTTKHIADDLITTQNLGKTTVDELAQSIGTVIPTASALGVSLDQLSTAYVLLTKQGINTANSTTYIRAMMNELSDSGSDVSETLGNLTGHSFGELMAQGKTLGDVMQILGDSVDGNGEAFKNLFSNVRSGLGALSLFNQGADAFNDTLARMENNAGAADKAFATMADTAEMTNQRFDVSVENLKIAIGESLSPAVEDFKKKGIGILQWFTEVAEKNPALVRALAGAAAGISTLAAVTATAAAAMGILRLAFGDAVGAAQVFTALGIAAATGALVGLAAASENATEKITESVNALTESHKAHQETAETNRTNIERIKELADRYTYLSEKASLSKEELSELNNITTELNTILPGCSAAYRENADAINEGTDAIKAQIEAMVEEQEYQANVEALTNAYKDQAEAEKALEESSNELKTAQEEMAMYEEQLANGITEAAMGYDNARERVAELTEKHREAQEVYDDTKSTIDELSASVEEYTKKSQEANETEEKRTDSLGVVYDSSLKVKDAEDAIKDATSAANEAIDKQIGLFDEWDKKSDLTLSKMQENWNKQTEGVNQYSDDLAYLKSEIIDKDVDPALKDLAGAMANVGVDGAAELHNFVEGLKSMSDNSEASKEKVKQLTETWEKHLKAIENADNIYESIQLQEQGFVEDSNVLWTEYQRERKTGQETFNTDISNLTKEGIDDQAKTIEDNTYLVEDASEKLMENSFSKACDAIGMPTTGGTSSKYSQMGQDMVDSIVDGLKDGDSKIGTALGNILQNAADSVNVSGIAAKINSQLATELNRELGR